MSAVYERFRLFFQLSSPLDSTKRNGSTIYILDHDIRKTKRYVSPCGASAIGSLVSKEA